MNCMKCGREIDETQAFCAGCLEEMDKYPVKPDVVVKLPNRQLLAQKKASPHRRTRTPEEQIARLKKRNRRLTVALCLLILITGLLAFLSIDVIRQLDVQRFIGQNYSTAETME